MGSDVTQWIHCVLVFPKWTGNELTLHIKCFPPTKGKTLCKPFSLSIQMLKEAAFVSRTVNQSYRQFSISSRGKSCFMKLLALVYDGNACLVHRWRSNNIHNIFCRGNGFYLNTLKSGKIAEAQTVAISNLPSLVHCIRETSWNISISYVIKQPTFA